MNNRSLLRGSKGVDKVQELNNSNRKDVNKANEEGEKKEDKKEEEVKKVEDKKEEDKPVEKQDVKIGEKLPDTLHFTSQSISEKDFIFGKYESQLVESEKETIKEQSQRMAEYVKNSMKHFWNGYEKCAFGYDEVKPISCTGNSNWGGIGMTIIDSLDTLYIMDLKDEFERGKNWVKEHLDFSKIHKGMSQFEITIRVLGGLLSSYSLTNDEIFKEKAIDIGNRIYNSFVGSVFPKRTINIADSRASGTKINAAEAGTFQLEFNYLSKISGDKKYENKAYESQKELKNKMNDGLFRIYISNGAYGASGEADSAYEYILKCWIQNGKKDKILREMFDKNKEGIINKLSIRNGAGLIHVGFLQGKSPSAIQEHLACFIPGLIALDLLHNPDNANKERDLEYAKSLAYTCYQTYMRQKTHLSPERVIFNNEGFESKLNFNILRPETVESLYILNQLTGDPIFKKWGWDIYLAFEKESKVANGYSAINDVNVPGSHKDSTESFWSAETLKYLYLLFDTNQKIDLNNYVFNTEAHPFKIN